MRQSNRANENNLQANILNLTVKNNLSSDVIEEIADYIPGSVMIQNLNSMTNLFMNKNGCDFLKRDKEELKLLGPTYFQKFFPEEEVAFLTVELRNFIALNDYNKVYSYFQQVRPNQQSEYKWFFTTAKLCRPANAFDKPNLMKIATEVTSISFSCSKLSDISETDTFFLKNYQKFNTLSKREKEIIALIAEGNSSQQIADSLFLSIHTVNNHRKNIFQKLNIKTLSQLVRFALTFSLLSP